MEHFLQEFIELIVVAKSISNNTDKTKEAN